MKICSICKTEKPLSEFHADARRGYGCRCKECNRVKVQEWRVKNRERHNASERKRYAESPAKWDRHLRTKYGISADEYAARLAAQGNCCAICKIGAADLSETLAVDHCHASGTVRGILCAKCNRMLGCAIDRPDVLRAGADYLINAKAAQVWIETVMDCQP